MPTEKTGSQRFQFNKEDYKRMFRDICLGVVAAIVGVLLTFIEPLQAMILETVGMNFGEQSIPYMFAGIILTELKGITRRFLTDYSKH